MPILFSRLLICHFLLQALQLPDTKVRSTAVHQLIDMRPSELGTSIPWLVNLLRDSDAGVRFDAAMLLQYAIPLADHSREIERAGHALVQALRDPDERVRDMAAAPLRQMNSEEISKILPALVDLLKDSEPLVRSAACDALQGLGSGATDAVPELMNALQDEASEVRAKAAIALSSTGVAVELLVLALKPLIQDSSPRVRSWAVLALHAKADRNAVLSPVFQTVIPLLVEALADPDSEVREHATRALARIAPQNVRNLQHLMDALRSSDERKRGNALLALRNTPGVPRDLVLEVADIALEDPDSSNRFAAIDSLGHWGPNAIVASPKLLVLLESSDPFFRMEAASALIKIDPNEPKCIEVLQAALEDPDDGIREMAALNLSMLDEQAQAAVPALVRALRDPSLDVRVEAALALSDLDPNTPGLALVLLEGLNQDQTDSKPRILNVLSRLKSHSTAEVSSLIDVLRTGNSSLRSGALKALQRLGSDAAEAVPALVEVLVHAPESKNRAEAAEALQLIRSASAVPALRKALNDRIPEVRHQAALALREIEPHELPVVRGLIEALDSKDYFTWIKALDSIADLGPEAKDAANPLWHRLKENTDFETRVRIVRAFEKVNPAELDRHTIALSTLLQDPSAKTRTEALALLAAIGPAARGAELALSTCLRDSDPEARMWAHFARWRITSGNSDPIDALRSGFQDQNLRHRWLAPYLLRLMKHAAAPALPWVTSLLKDPEEAVRANALWALDGMGPAARSAIPELRELVEQHDLD